MTLNLQTLSTAPRPPAQPIYPHTTSHTRIFPSHSLSSSLPANPPIPHLPSPHLDLPPLKNLTQAPTSHRIPLPSPTSPLPRPRAFPTLPLALARPSPHRLRSSNAASYGALPRTLLAARAAGLVGVVRWTRCFEPCAGVLGWEGGRGFGEGGSWWGFGVWGRCGGLRGWGGVAEGNGGSACLNCV